MKSKVTQLGEAKNASHGRWHVASQQCGRKRGWYERDAESLAAARAALDAAEAEPSDEEGNLRDCSAERSEVIRLEGVVNKRLHELETAEAEVAVLATAKDEAVVALAEEVFNVEHLQPFGKVMLQLHEMNKKLAEAESKLPSRPQFALQFLTDDLLAAWMKEKEARCNPPVAREPDWNGMVLFTRDWSPGGLSGKRYSVGDGGYFDPKLASEIVAGNFARYQRPSAETEKLVQAAKQRLAAIDPTAGILGVDPGWR